MCSLVFRKDIFQLLQGVIKFEWNESTQFSFKIILSMIPAVFVGLFLQDSIEVLFLQNKNNPKT